MWGKGVFPTLVYPILHLKKLNKTKKKLGFFFYKKKITWHRHVDLDGHENGAWSYFTHVRSVARLKS